MIFKGFSLKQIKNIFLEGENPTLTFSPKWERVILKRYGLTKNKYQIYITFRGVYINCN